MIKACLYVLYDTFPLLVLNGIPHFSLEYGREELVRELAVSFPDVNVVCKVGWELRRKVRPVHQHHFVEAPLLSNSSGVFR
jgi:hypothetical protein